MYEEDDLLPISAIRQLAFCARRCALIHIEGVWADNVFTAEGKKLHERTHQQESESRVDVRIVRGLPLRCMRLGLVGKADVVEFHRLPENDDGPPGVTLQGARGLWRPFPVEYKRGSPNPDTGDEVQLCAQALCLEEMLRATVPAGAVFYGQPRRRHQVELSAQIRFETERLAAELHKLIGSRQTPAARYQKKCRGCSLLDLCMPKSAGAGRSAVKYLERAIAAATAEED